MAANDRFVDTLPSPEKRHHVDVIVLGLSRTGTMSIYQAFKKLGYRSYHMSEACLMTRNGHLTMWNEAIRAKYGPGQLPRYTAADFDKLLAGYDALTDIPCILFIPELLEAYPNARLVLTTHPRGPEGWLQSMGNSYFRISNWSVWSWPMMVHDTAFSLPYMTLVRRVMELWTSTSWPEASDFSRMKPNLETFYARHNDEMLRLARESGRELLEFDPRQGWEPLCSFLAKDVPTEPYPHANEGNHVVNIHKVLVLMRLKAVWGASIAKVLGGVSVAAIAWWWMRK